MIFQGLTSEVLDISASIIQVSAIGPVSYVISASDLSTMMPGNSMLRYADDTYVVIPAMLSPDKVSLIMLQSWLREII